MINKIDLFKEVIKYNDDSIEDIISSKKSYEFDVFHTIMNDLIDKGYEVRPYKFKVEKNEKEEVTNINYFSIKIIDGDIDAIKDIINEKVESNYYHVYGNCKYKIKKDVLYVKITF